jgi:hypothetical protein
MSYWRPVSPPGDDDPAAQCDMGDLRILIACGLQHHLIPVIRNPEQPHMVVGMAGGVPRIRRGPASGTEVSCDRDVPCVGPAGRVICEVALPPSL